MIRQASARHVLKWCLFMLLVYSSNTNWQLNVVLIQAGVKFWWILELLEGLSRIHRKRVENFIPQKKPTSKKRNEINTAKPPSPSYSWDIALEQMRIFQLELGIDQNWQPENKTLLASVLRVIQIRTSLHTILTRRKKPLHRAAYKRGNNLGKLLK